MTYTVSGTNFNQQLTGQDAVRQTSINYKENTNKAAGVQGAFAGVVMSNGGNIVNKDNTYESLIKEADDVKSQIMASASDAKIGLKALMMKLSGAGAVKIDEDGFNLTDATEDDMVNIVEKIRIELAMHSDSYVNYGTPVSMDKVQSVAGSPARANAIYDRLSNSSLEVNEENVAEISGALDKLDNIFPLSEDTKNYMVANSIEPSIDGIYQASKAVSARAVKVIQPVSDAEFDNIKKQIDTVINSAGLDVNEENESNAKAFIERQIPVTEENLLYKAELDRLNISDIEKVIDRIVDNMSVGNEADSVYLTDRVSPMEEFKEAVETLNRADYEDVENVIKSGAAFTIAQLKASMGANYSNIDFVAASATMVNQENADRAYNVMVEARILMTSQSGAFFVNNNISAMNTPLTELVSQLKNLEGSMDVYEASTELYSEVFSVRKALSNIMYSPVQVVAEVMKQVGRGDGLTIGAFAQTGSEMSRNYERARRDYEAVGTEVRKDLGDSVNKAVANSTDSFVRELGLEGNKAQREAIRILAMNNMDVTYDNVDRVSKIYTVLNNLIDNMKPETVLNMIKDGINPMNTDINELNEYLTAMNQQAGRDNEEKFSKFLFKLDRTNGIDAEHRKKFIGIYQMMNIFTKDAGTALGALINQGAEINMKNLISAYSSRKHGGIDETISDETGMTEVSGNINYYISLFAQSEKLVTPNTLKNVEDEYGIAEQSVESFIEELEEKYDAEVEAEYFEEYLQNVSRAADAEKSVLRDIRYADMKVNGGNINAIKELMESGNFPIIKNNRFTQESDEAIERIGHKEQLELMYEEMRDDVEQELQEAISLSADEDTDISINYEEFFNIRMKDRQIGYIANLAMKHDYRIPFATQDGVGIVNLTLIQDGEDKGRISIKMNTNAFGEISLEARVDARSMGVMVISDKNDADTDGRFEAFAEDIKSEFGFDEVKLFSSVSKEVPYVRFDGAEDSVATDRLYEIAGHIVKFLAAD